MRNDVPPEGRPLIPAGAEPQFRKNFGERARQLGIDMTGDVDRVPNTLLLHVCLHWAYEQEPRKQHALKGLIFQAYYSKNIFLNAENLALLAAQAGYDAAAALAHLRSGTGEAEIKQRSDAAKRSGIDGIPFFMINDKPAFSGAQEPAKFKEVLLRNAR